MRIILSILFALFSFIAFGQVYQTQNSPFNFVRGIKQDTIAIIPRGCDTVALPSTKFGARTIGALYFDTCANTLYARGSFGWVPITGGVDSADFEPIIDSTGNENYRVLFAVGNKIVGSSKLIYDSVLSLLRINNNSTFGSAYDLAIGGSAQIAGDLFLKTTEVGDTSWKPIVQSGNLAAIRRLPYWPVVNDPAKLNISDTADMLNRYIVSAYRTPGIDSIYFQTRAGNVFAVKDSTGGGTTYTAGNGIKIDGSTIRWADSLINPFNLLDVSSSLNITSNNRNGDGNFANLYLNGFDNYANLSAGNTTSDASIELSSGGAYINSGTSIEIRSGVSDSVKIKSILSDFYTPKTTTTSKYKAVLMDSTTGALVTISPDSLGGSGGADTTGLGDLYISNTSTAEAKQFNVRTGRLDSLLARGSGGLNVYSNGGTLAVSIGQGGAGNVNHYGFAGYNSNLASTYTARSFTDKNYVDSVAATRGVVRRIGAISSTATANGAFISNDTLYLAAASSTTGGVLTSGTQDIAGAKTFAGQITADGGIRDPNNLTLTGGNGNSWTAGNVNITTNSNLGTGSLGRTILGITGTYSGTSGQFGADAVRIMPTLDRATPNAALRFVGINYLPTVTNMAERHYAMLLQSGDVGIGNSSTDASSILEITSTTKGVLLPRMTTAQQNAITSPAQGLIIYNTDTVGFVQYTGSAWRRFGTLHSLNGLTGGTQTFTTGTTGTDFNISSGGTTHTFNLPTASSVNRGALSTADWSTFNGKQNSIDTLSSTLLADVSMPSALTWYSGPSVTLSAGTWLIMGHITITNATGAGRYVARIYNGTVAVASGNAAPVNSGNRGSTISMMKLVSPTGSTTYTLQGYSSVVNGTIKYQSDLDVNDGATVITAIKLR
jgi:hypothetical protein